MGPEPGDGSYSEEMHMRNFLALMAAAFLTLAGVGWYLGWYDVLIQPGSGGHHRVDIDVNIPKIKDDWNKGEEKGKQKLQQVLETNKKKTGLGFDDGSSESR
jgi:hypothetical protein